MVAVKEDRLIRHMIAIEVIVAAGSKVGIAEVFYFDAKANDIGCNDKIIIAVPEIDHEAKQFAKKQGVRVFRLEELENLIG
jgi:hypothetical protein